MSVSFFPFLKRLVILLSIPLLFLSACSQPLSLLQTSNTPHLLWTAPITGYYPLMGFPEVIANGIVYYNGDKLYAFDATTGRQKWTAPNNSGLNIPNFFPPVVTNGVILNFVDNKLHAFDAATGQLKWSNDAIADFIAANGVVYAVDTKSTHIDALDATTGQQKWTAPAGNDPVSGLPGVANHVIAVTNGVVYADTVGAPTILYALDAATGQATRSFSTRILGSPLASPVVANGMVYLNAETANSPCQLYAFDTATGQQKWTARTGDQCLSGPVAVVNGVVYVVDPTKDNEKLDAFDAATGQLKWTVPTPTPYYGMLDAPIVANGVVYAIYYRQYNLYAYDAATGQQKWSMPIDDIPLGATTNNGPNALTIANGIAYIAIPETNKLYAFSLK